MAQKAVRGPESFLAEVCKADIRDWYSPVNSPQSTLKSSWNQAEILHGKIRKSLVNPAFFRRCFPLVKAPFLV